MTRQGLGARWTLRLILTGGLALMLWLSWPGHMSVDSVLALREGRFGVRETWNPAIYGWLLGVLDSVWSGPAPAIVLAGLLLFGGWFALPSLRPRTSWLAPVLALAAIALPQVLIYPAIVWKDVLFAVVALAGFVILAFAVRDGGRSTPWASLVMAALLFAVAGLLRQNGLVLALPAALAMAWARSGQGWGRAIRGAGAWLVGILVLTLALSAVARPQGIGAPDNAGGRGLRLLQTYDLAAAAALQPGRPTPRVDAQAPAVGAYLRDHAARLYSPERVDVLTADPWLAKHLRQVSRATIRAEWLDLITDDTPLYLRARTQSFLTVLTTPEVMACLPVHVGIVGPPSALKDLAMPRRASVDDGRLYNYATYFFDTPAMSHLVFGGFALITLLALMVRRDPADLVIAGFMAGAIGFAATFFVISIACDYRYLYILDLAGLTGLLYLAIDPRLRRA